MWWKAAQGTQEYRGSRIQFLEFCRRWEPGDNHELSTIHRSTTDMPKECRNGTALGFPQVLWRAEFTVGLWECAGGHGSEGVFVFTVNRLQGFDFWLRSLVGLSWVFVGMEGFQVF